MNPSLVQFDKYNKMGAYHWIQSDRGSPMYNPPLEARYKVLIKRLERTKRILEVGCGDGYLVSLASGYSETVVGIDSELTGIQLAAQKLQPFANCTVGQASCYNLPFAPSSFDYVLLADVFEHLEQPDLCIKEICRVLTPNGSLLLTTPKWRSDRMWDRLHVKEYRPEEVEECLRRFFSTVHLTYFWPLAWFNRTATKLGRKLVKIFSRHFYNPFLQESDDPQNYGQILAMCEDPYK